MLAYPRLSRLFTVAVIPARFGSTRFPGKPLSDIHGKPMVWHVWQRVRAARRVDRVLVATDDERIADAVRAFGGEVVMTSPNHVSGTDRVAEAVRGMTAEIVVNVQGDEPLLDPDSVDAAVAPLIADPSIEVATLSLPLVEVEEMLSASVVKVVTDTRGRALYFSRSPIPFVRRGESPQAAAAAAVAEGLARKHVGLYAFCRPALERFVSLPPSRLERAESLEQLRALENGMSIAVAPIESQAGPAVDTPQDLEKVRALMAGSGGRITR
jgi:3-deoxy-manno-octulosonate cytidylyltransferase (CMP-KDO synthetase)